MFYSSSVTFSAIENQFLFFPFPVMMKGRGPESSIISSSADVACPAEQFQEFSISDLFSDFQHLQFYLKMFWPLVRVICGMSGIQSFCIILQVKSHEGCFDFAKYSCLSHEFGGLSPSLWRTLH